MPDQDLMPNIEFIGAHPVNFEEGRGGVAPEAVVLHIAEGPLSAVDATFNEVHDPEEGPTSAHFCVAKDGTIHQYVNTGDTAFANGIIEEGFTARLIDENPDLNPNQWTISIEHEGETGDEVTPEQFDISTRLTARLFQEILLTSGASGVEVDRDHILRHADITPINREDCPGWSEEFIADYIARVRTLLGL